MRAYLLALLFLAGAGLRADDSLDHARRAQALLGPELWSRVIRIENSTRAGPYPRTLHALVFELAGRLWFYTETDGTQSFSLHAGRLAEEKADFGPLLRDIDPGFGRWREIPAGKRPPVVRDKLPNGCFIESVAALRTRLVAGADVGRPQLLSYYGETEAGVRGHTVLTYESNRGLEVVDPATASTHVFPPSAGADALGLARALEGKRVAQARWLPVELPLAPGKATRVAGVASMDESSLLSPRTVALR